jgi:GNAT superfamily N-acetyltransferase
MIEVSILTTVELERITALGWQGTTTSMLGEWLLRAGSGFTGRANSVLPLGSPGMPIDQALDAVTDFYDRNQLPPLFQVPLTAETAELEKGLAQRGWASFNESVVMVGALPVALSSCPPALAGATARFDGHPSDQWLNGYLYRGNPLPPTAIAVLENAENVVFASLHDEHGQAAVVRGVITDGWLGVTALTVDESRRRTGVGTSLMRELLLWAGARSATRVYLQVAAENEGAIGFYGRLGFTEHHRYHYRRPKG